MKKPIKKEGKNYKDRLKNPKRIINHGIEEQNAYCRQCDFRATSIFEKSILKKANTHAGRTGHTVDVYTETHKEITYYKKPNA